MDPISLQLGTRNLHGWLVRLLSRNLEWLDAKVKLFLPNVDLGSEYQAPDPTQRVILHLQKLHTQGPTTWKSFIQGVCMELDVPMDMEVLLMSTWGHEDGFPSLLEIGKESRSDSQLHPGLKRTYQSCGSSPRRKQLRKQQQELAKRYLQLLRTSVQQRYGDRTPGLGQPLAFHQVYVPPILQWSRASAPFHTQEGATTGDPKAEDGADVNIRDLFSTKASKGPRVTVLLGKAGMGKTTLAHRLCQKWADGQLDRFQAVFLFEFRQLNLITGSLTLPQLLFDVHLRPEASPEAIFQHLKENAEGILLIFDGLDEILQPCSDKETADPEDPASALTLFSRLCRGTLLPGCWVMATSRPGKLPACLPTEAATVHMWGFDGPRVEEYVNHFFSDQPSREAALAELRVDRCLWSMCAVPALCQVACLCLHHLLPGRSPGQAAALLPTMTQNYVQMLLALDPQGVLQAEPLLGLGEVALSGLESGKVIFSTGDIPASTLAFGDALGLLTSFCVCTGPGHQDKGYAFSHLSLQEFFAALHLMTRPQVDREALSQHVTLHSRWVQRTKARLGLSDHLPTFLAGLASRACCSFLSLLAQREEEWVAARQEIVLQALKKLATRRLTGPKIVELCHCVGETQEPELASFMAHSLPQQLPFHNFLLTYADMASLTNILGHRDGPIHLDFEGCPLEPRCPETLAGCGQVENLRLAGSKITARGISHLVQALPFCPQLEEVSFQDNQLKDKEVLNIVKVLSCLPRLQKLDLSRNNVSVSTLLSLTKVAVTCPTIKMLQVRETDLIFLLSPPTETAAELQGDPDLKGNANQRKEAQRRSLALRLQKCQLGVHDVEVLIAQLQEGPQLDEVDLSGNQLKDEGCQLMAEATPQLHITKKLDLSDNGLSVAGVLSVLSVVSTCQTLAELHISLLHKTVVFTFAPELEEQEGIQKRATFPDSLTFQMPSEPSLRSPRIRLTHCALQAQRLELLCKALGGSCRLGHLDLSGNALGDEGVALLAQLLPGLGSLQSLNLSENRLSLEGVLSLTQCFSTLPWLLHLEFSSASQHIILRGDKRGSLKECQLEPLSLSHLCKSLEKCPGPLEVQLSCEVLSDQSLETLLHHLPQLPQLSLLQLSQTQLPPGSPLLLADLFSLCPQVQKVDLRSLRHLTLHLRSSEEQEDGCCWFTDCGLRQEHVEPLCCLLSKCEDLNQLDLSANLLGDDGLRCLLECLPKVPISGSLNLSHNSMSQESVLCLVEALPSCPRVQEASVNLGSKQSFWIHFSRQEEAGKTLRLSECHFKPEHMPRLAASLNQALQLAELTLTWCFPGLEQLIVLLSLLTWPTGVLTLRVEEPWVGRAGLLSLLEVCAQASGNITEISISETQKQLCIQLEFPHQENPEAVALRLAHCDLGTHQNLLARRLMETCARLRQLSLSQVNLCDAGSLLLQSLLLSLSELKNFRLTYSCVSSKGLAHLTSGLSHCHLLEELDLSNNQFGDEGTKVLLGALEGKCRLKRLDLSHLPLGGSTLAVLTQGLGHMTLLQSLRLSHNQIGNTGAQDLAAVLPGLPELRKIDLSANGIGPAGGARLAESLTLCRHLEELMLGCNALEDCTALGLAKGLPQHLRVLHLPSSHLSPEGMLSLGQALDGSPHVEEISLAENSLAGGVPRFHQGLPVLRQLDLVSCEIDNQTAKPLAASFVLCPALEKIMLSWNLLGDEAAAELARVLPQMGRLKRVDLEKNRITAYGAWLLAEGLAQGSGIQVIRLWNNPIPPDMAQHLQNQEPRLDFAFFDNQPQVIPRST
ncbi:protein NLRC5 isoform X10 [Capricornis sumatraensis]|uniref:protein NLRC5 isoform X10 n=1 Tax=Capricornis sumatraensis TaxID=34865 RepID=UPI003604A272